MPAKLKPSKEKSTDLITKEYESGKSRNARPSKPTSLNFSKKEDSSSSDTTPEEDYKTPSVENVPLPGEHLSGASDGEKGKQFDAFFVDTNSPKKAATPKSVSPKRRANKPVSKGDVSNKWLNFLSFFKCSAICLLTISNMS